MIYRGQISTYAEYLCYTLTEREISSIVVLICFHSVETGDLSVITIVLRLEVTTYLFLGSKYLRQMWNFI